MQKALVSSNGRYDDSLTLEQATGNLRELLGEFPFGDWVDIADVDGGGRQSRSQAVQIAAMMSQFAIGMLPRGANRMGFIYNANSQRSGKTLLAKIAIMPLHRSFKAQAWKKEEDDLSKIVDSEVLAGSTYICFDNVRDYVGSESLEGLMTTPEWTGRVLGQTKMFTAENRLTLFVTGNDCMVSSDMSHRCLLCDLFVAEGNVQERQVENLIDEPWLQELKNRKMILSSLWAIVRYWDQAGKPKASDLGYKPRLGFERWGELIGGLVGFAGFGNCLAAVHLENAGDALDRNIRGLVAKLIDDRYMLHENRELYKFDQIVNICRDNGLFEWELEGKENAGGEWKLTHKANSRFSKLLQKFAPQKEPRAYSLEYEGKPIKVHFSNEGEGHNRRYIVEKIHPA